MTVTAHLIDVKNNKIKKSVLETKEFTGNYTAERIVGRLENIWHEWSVGCKIDCFVSKLLMYENEREIYRNENPLEWWNLNKTKYLILSQLAYKYLCITGTSVPSKRMFSASCHLTSDRHSRLTPENTDILLFLNKNR